MNRAYPSIFEHLATLSDVTRSRILLLLDGHELTVSELCAVLQLPQSTVSRHLKALADDNWISARAEATSRLYVMTPVGMGPPAQLWALVREQAGKSPAAAQDQQRLQAALAQRRSRSREFFATAAEQWDRLRKELFGERLDLTVMAAMAQPDWTAGDLGCGTGQFSAALAPFVRRVVGVDESSEMLEGARLRLAQFGNVELRHGQLEALPLDDASIDLAALVIALPYAPEPAIVLREAARVLKPGGRLLLVDMLPHDREGYRQQMGHVWLGFGVDQMQSMLHDAGFEQTSLVPLPPDTHAKGPSLFAVRARKPKQSMKTACELSQEKGEHT